MLNLVQAMLTAILMQIYMMIGKISEQCHIFESRKFIGRHYVKSIRV